MNEFKIEKAKKEDDVDMGSFCKMWHQIFNFLLLSEIRMKLEIKI